MIWKKPTERPATGDRILILEENGRIVEDYMATQMFPGESRVTFSFHGRYYDFQKSTHVFGLINCYAWMPIPQKPMWQDNEVPNDPS